MIAANTRIAISPGQMRFQELLLWQVFRSDIQGTLLYNLSPAGDRYRRTAIFRSSSPSSCTESRETRRSIEIKHQVSECCRFCKAHNCRHFISAADQRHFVRINQVCYAIHNCQSSYNIFLCDKSCDSRRGQLPYANPSGINRIANGCAILARIEVLSAPSSTSWNCQLKLCMICTTVLHTRIIVPAFTI